MVAGDSGANLRIGSILLLLMFEQEGKVTGYEGN